MKLNSETRKAERHVGAPVLTLRSLRLTLGSGMAAGVAIRAFQEWMGHEEVKMIPSCGNYAPSSRERALVSYVFARISGAVPFLFRDDRDGTDVPGKYSDEQLTLMPFRADR
jgi:hypothetical protein